MRTRKSAVLTGHEGPVSCVDISPDDEMLATGSEDGTARLWTAAGQPKATLAAGGAVREVRFMGSGERLLVVTNAGLAIWNDAGQKLAAFPPARHAVAAGGLLMLPAEGQVRFADRDGKVLREMATTVADVGAGDIAFYAITPDGRVRWYDRKGNEQSVKPAAGTTRVTLAASGNVIATFGTGHAVELWSPEGKKLADLVHGGPVEAVSVSADGQRVLSAAADRQYSFWRDGKLVRRVPKPGPARFVAASLAYGISIALDGDGHITLWYPTLYEGDEMVSTHVEGRVRRIEPSCNANGLMVEKEDGTRTFMSYTHLKEIDVRKRLWGQLRVSRWGNRSDWQLLGDDRGLVTLRNWDRLPPLYLVGHTGAISDGCFSSDDRLLLTASRDHTARLWEIVPAEMPLLWHDRNGVSGLGYTSGTNVVTIDWTGVHFWDGDGRPLRSIALPRYLSAWVVGKGIAVATTGDKTAKLYDSNGRDVAVLEHDGVITSMCRSWNEADRIATWSTGDKTARIWDVDGNRRATLKHPSGVLVASFTPDGSLITVAEDNLARVWSTGGNVMAQFQVSSGVTACACSSKGDRLIFCYGGRDVRICTEKGKEVGRLTGHTADIRLVDISPQGDSILTVSDDNTARLWDMDGRPVKVIEHPKEVWIGLFLPEQDGFITGCGDGLVRHWDRDGSLRAVMNGREDLLITCASYTDDGRWLGTGSDGGTAYVWPLKRDDLLRLARDRVARDFTPEERKLYQDLFGK
jgi:WD40 repeat protein